MKRFKTKFAGLLVATMLSGGVSGIAMADDDSDDDGPPGFTNSSLKGVYSVITVDSVTTASSQFANVEIGSGGEVLGGRTVSFVVFEDVDPNNAIEVECVLASGMFDVAPDGIGTATIGFDCGGGVADLAFDFIVTKASRSGRVTGFHLIQNALGARSGITKFNGTRLPLRRLP